MPKESGPHAAAPEYAAETSAPLPSELAEFFKLHRYACVTETTNRGVAYVVKTMSSDIATLKGALPIWVRYQLYEHPLAPVIRTVMRLYDRPKSPLCFESFSNVADNTQRAEFAALAAQERLLFLFYDEGLALRLQKSVVHVLAQRRWAKEILDAAVSLSASIPPAQFDFEKAKAAVMASTDI